MASKTSTDSVADTEKQVANGRRKGKSAGKDSPLENPVAARAIAQIERNRPHAQRSRRAKRPAKLKIIPPMLTSPGALPLGSEWAYELKWDGLRAMAYVVEGESHLLTRTGQDVTARYPELQALARKVPREALPLILDGELVALGQRGVPDFSRLQRRMDLKDRQVIRDVMADVPVDYAVFDIAMCSGESVIGRSYLERRELLDELFETAAGPHWSAPRFQSDGEKLLEHAEAMGFEGIVAKRRDSIYEPGRRTQTWIKIKQRPRQEFVVGGWTEGEGARSGTLGSVLLGAYDNEGDKKLRYYGRVGTGFDSRTLSDLFNRLLPLETDTNPFQQVPPSSSEVHYAQPQLVAEVEYVELNRDGTLRQPIYHGLRNDKPAGEVLFER